MSYPGPKDQVDGVVSLDHNGIATLESPVLTGIPIAPTPLGSDSSTTIATTAAILNKLLTGLTADEGRVVATDTIIQTLSRLSHAPTFTALRLSSNGSTIILGTAPNTVTFDIAAASGVNIVKFPGGNVTSTSVIGITPPALGTILSYIGTDGIQNTATIIGNQGIAIDVTTPGQLQVSNYRKGKLIDVNYTLTLADGNFIQIGVSNITITLPLIRDILADPKWGQYSEIVFTNLQDTTMSSIAPQSPDILNGTSASINIEGPFNTTIFYVHPVYGWLIK